MNFRLSESMAASNNTNKDAKLFLINRADSVDIIVMAVARSMNPRF